MRILVVCIKITSYIGRSPSLIVRRLCTTVWSISNALMIRCKTNHHFCQTSQYVEKRVFWNGGTYFAFTIFTKDRPETKVEGSQNHPYRNILVVELKLALM